MIIAFGKQNLPIGPAAGPSEKPACKHYTVRELPISKPWLFGKGPMTRERETYHILQPRSVPSTLSIVIPMYNEAAMVEFLRAEVAAFLPTVPAVTEVIVINDGSSDKTLDHILKWAADDSRIKVIHLSRNYGHQVAATAGLDYATGDAVVLLDADLQDPLPIIHEMIKRYCEGYDIVFGQREKREGESTFKIFTAWAFYRLMRRLIDERLPVDTGDFRLMSRDCLDGLRSMRETHRFLRGMVAWAGYPQFAVRYRRGSRVAGTSKYPLHKMLSFAWTAATSFSTLPLKLSLIFGFIVGMFSIEEGFRAILASLLGWYTVQGWTSLMVVTTMIGSALLISIGVLGQYVGNIYEQSKERPLYLVSRTFNFAAPRLSGNRAQPIYARAIEQRR